MDVAPVIKIIIITVIIIIIIITYLSLAILLLITTTPTTITVGIVRSPLKPVPIQAKSSPSTRKNCSILIVSQEVGKHKPTVVAEIVVG